MAVLTPSDLAPIRQGWEQGNTTAYSKAVVNAAIQAIEDWFEANRASLSGAINTATSPTTITAADKKLLVFWWLKSKFERGG